jgi:hypothetical protein
VPSPSLVCPVRAHRSGSCTAGAPPPSPRRVPVPPSLPRASSASPQGEQPPHAPFSQCTTLVSAIARGSCPAPPLARLAVCSTLWCSRAGVVPLAESARSPSACLGQPPILWCPVVAGLLVSGEFPSRDRAAPPHPSLPPCR